MSDETDAKVLNDVQERFDVSITPLPDEIDLSSYSKFFLFCFDFIVPIIKQFFFSWGSLGGSDIKAKLAFSFFFVTIPMFLFVPT